MSEVSTGIAVAFAAFVVITVLTITLGLALMFYNHDYIFGGIVLFIGVLFGCFFAWLVNPDISPDYQI